MDHAVTVQVFKVQKDAGSQVTGGPCSNSAGVQSAERCGESGGPCCNSAGVKVQKDVVSQVTGGPCCNSAGVKVQKDVVSQVTGGPCYNNAGVQNAERCESDVRWTML